MDNIKQNKSPVKKVILDESDILKLQKGIEVLKLDPDQDMILIIKPSPKQTYTEIILDKLGLNKLETKLTHDPNGKPF
jgi:hypothetical protein